MRSGEISGMKIPLVMYGEAGKTVCFGLAIYSFLYIYYD